MSTLRTTITEVVTALGMTGIASLDEALALRPDVMVNVTQGEWDRLTQASVDGLLADVFLRSWENGRAFFEAPQGLRQRPPIRIEWKGDDRSVGDDPIPADLRVDHVYLISCKDNSKILRNPPPARLFDDLLAGQGGAAIDWYQEVGPEALQTLWAAVRLHHDDLQILPANVTALTAAQREIVKAALPTWPEELTPAYGLFCSEISQATAARWRVRLNSTAIQERMYWRMIRLAAAPYFLLGRVDGVPIRLRVGTPWDWRQHFELVSFAVASDLQAGQPIVRWDAEIRERVTHDIRHVVGHVEVRWSRGRFRRPPEAKVYLDTPHAEVAGYFSVT